MSDSRNSSKDAQQSDDDPTPIERPITRLALLDGLRLVMGGRDVALPSRSQRLLSLLALRGPLARGVVAGYLWPEVPERRARASVRAAVRDLQARAPRVLSATTAALSLDKYVHIDLSELRILAQRLLLPLPDDATLTRGLELVPGGAFGGELLPNWRDDWAVAEAERLHQLRLHVLDALVDHLVARGRHALALQVALAAIPVDPLRESTHRAAMRVFVAEGNTVDALRQYEKFRAMVRVEMGIEPSRLMIDLVDEIVSDQATSEPLTIVRRRS